MAGVKKTVKTMAEIFVQKRVMRSAAALSYYLTVSFFPFLIVVYAVLTSFNITTDSVYRVFGEIIPQDVLQVILDYFQYVGRNETTTMIFIGVAVALSSSSTAFGSMMRIMADIQGKSRFKGIKAFAFSLVISVGFLAVIYASGLIIFSGEWLLGTLEKLIGYTIVTIWQWVRFALLFALLLAVIYLIYEITAPRESTRVRRLPGALIATVLLVAASMVFSKLIGYAATYPIVYGSLTSVIILMFWVYICGIILIMGNVFNYVVYHHNLQLVKPDCAIAPPEPEDEPPENNE